MSARIRTLLVVASSLVLTLIGGLGFRQLTAQTVDRCSRTFYGSSNYTCIAGCTTVSGRANCTNLPGQKFFSANVTAFQYIDCGPYTGDTCVNGSPYRPQTACSVQG